MLYHKHEHKQIVYTSGNWILITLKTYLWFFYILSWWWWQLQYGRKYEYFNFVTIPGTSEEYKLSHIPYRRYVSACPQKRTFSIWMTRARGAIEMNKNNIIIWKTRKAGKQPINREHSITRNAEGWEMFKKREISEQKNNQHTIVKPCHAIVYTH